MNIIYFNGRAHDLKEVKKRNSTASYDYERKILDFCAQWLNGEINFSANTSGSTGKPKSISLSRAQMILSAKMTAGTLGLKSGDRSLICLNTEFIAGKMMLVRGLETGMEMHIVLPSSNPLKEFPEDFLFDFTALVPFQLECILNETPEKKSILNRMKAILIGGASIGKHLEEKLQDIKAPIYHTFGMTETVSHIALRRLNGTERSENFKTLENISVSSDSRNCLVIHSSLTKEPITSNDVVEIISAHEFKWLGRADNIINSGGIKIQPEKVEKAIEGIFHSRQINKKFFIAGLPHRELGEASCIIIEDEAWSPQQIETLKTELQKILTRYEVPKEFYFVKPFPETPTGKTDRLKIKEEIAKRK